MYDKPKESDWKLFRNMLPDLKEKYLEKTNKELAEILCDPNKNQTEKFWATEEKVCREVKVLKDCLDNYSRSQMDTKVMLMCRYGMLEKKDLEKFSEEFQDRYRDIWAKWNT